MFLFGVGLSRNRSLATFLLVHAVLRFTEALAGPVRTLGGLQPWLNIAPYFALADDLALLYFILTLPGIPAWIQTPYNLPIFVLAVLAMDIAYGVNHSLYWEPYAPLSMLDSILTGFAYALVPLWLVVRGLRNSKWRSAMILISCALASWLVYSAAAGLVFLVLDSRNAEFVFFGVELDARLRNLYLVLFAILNGICVTLVATMARAAVRSRQNGVSVFAVGSSVLLLAVVSGVATGAWARTQDSEQVLTAWVAGIASWYVVGSLLLAYVVLRFRHLSIDKKVKKGLGVSSVGFLMFLGFLVTGELVEALFSVSGAGYGLAVAVAIGVSFRPLENKATRWLNKRWQTDDARRQIEFAEAAFEDQVRRTRTRVFSRH